MNNTLYVCFLENDEEIMEHHILNRLAANLAPKTSGERPKIHVELFFPSEIVDEEADVMTGKACSIYYNQKVFLTQKSFSRKQWSFRKLSDLTDEQYKHTYNFCKNHVGDGFNHLTYFTYPMNCQQVTPYWTTNLGMKPRWFCSEICVEALKAGGILDEKTWASIHPENLYTMLKTNSTPDCVRNYDKMKLVFT
jgi:hypothetical protein